MTEGFHAFQDKTDLHCTYMKFALALSVLFGAVVFGLVYFGIYGNVNCICDCEICTFENPPSSPKYMRSGYMALITVFSAVAVFFFRKVGKEVFTGDFAPSYRPSFVVSCCLFLNSLGFMLYDSIDDTTPYFAITLWFTELIPILYIAALLSAEEFYVYRLVFERVGKRRRDYDYLIEEEANPSKNRGIRGVISRLKNPFSEEDSETRELLLNTDSTLELETHQMK
jgi:hypothetical protein